MIHFEYDYMGTDSKTEYMSLKEAAQYFGMTRLTIWRWVRDRKVNFIQPNGSGGRILIPKDGPLKK